MSKITKILCSIGWHDYKKIEVGGLFQHKCRHCLIYHSWATPYEEENEKIKRGKNNEKYHRFLEQTENIYGETGFIIISIDRGLYGGIMNVTLEKYGCVSRLKAREVLKLIKSYEKNIPTMTK